MPYLPGSASCSGKRTGGGAMVRCALLLCALGLSACVNNPNYIALENTGASPDASADRERESERAPDRADRATPPAREAPDTADLPSVYTVQKGDTLYSIAFRYSRDFRELAAANNIESPYLIVPGQKIDTEATVSASSAQDRSSSGSSVASDTPPAPASTAPSPSVSGPQEDAESDWIWPVEGEVLADFSDGATGTKGIDIGAERGTGIRAAADGQVVYAGDGLRGYGNLIILEHQGRMLSAYAFTEEIAVAEQDSVTQGERIASVGVRGDTPLLHFEIRSEGKPVDPEQYLP